MATIAIPFLGIPATAHNDLRTSGDPIDVPVDVNLAVNDTMDDDDTPLSSSMGAAQDPITAFCSSLWFWRTEQ